MRYVEILIGDTSIKVTSRPEALSGLVYPYLISMDNITLGTTNETGSATFEAKLALLDVTSYALRALCRFYDNDLLLFEGQIESITWGNTVKYTIEA